LSVDCDCLRVSLAALGSCNTSLSKTVNIMRTDVRRPLPTIAVMFGMPSRMAHEDVEPSRDEDNLDRKRDFNGGPTNTLDLIYERLKQGDEVTAHAAMAIARCLQEMAHQAARGDKAGLNHWYQKCCDLIANVDGDEEEEDGNG
jgi:hypothetical protein